MSPLSRLTAAAVLALASLAFAGEHVVDMSAQGFTISALDPMAGTGTYQSLIMMLPASERFAPNVNVVIQDYNGTFEDYMKQSRDEFGKMGAKVLADKAGKNEGLFEYVAQQQGREMHFYARVIVSKGK